MNVPAFFPLPRMMPAAIPHQGRFVRLQRQDPVADAAELFRISHGMAGEEALWRYLPAGPFPDTAAMGDFLKNWGAAPDLIAYTVRDAAGKEVLGTLSLMSLRPAHGVGELGNIWFGPAAQRTAANTESNYLLLRYCFEELGYRRMEWKCHALNEPSRRAALRLGFNYEGTFRQHMIVKGLNRDTAWFAMMDHEWPAVKAALEAWLAAPASLPPFLCRPAGASGESLTDYNISPV
jgi:RimJ/RimL family protein N-acetyltransferase